MILPITMKDKQYDVVIKQNALKEIEQHLDLNKKVLILTDSGVPTKYSQMIAEKAKEAYIYTIPQGEASKSFENFEKILDYLIEHSFSRTDAIVACGGGVVGDLAGFVASTYMRGITFYNVPTTLLSQVDSSIGGKTAIEADIPMASLNGYCTDLRSMTGGRGDYSYTFARYEQAPSDVQEKEVAARAALASAESVVTEKGEILDRALSEKDAASADLTNAQNELSEVERYM
mgnify:CR=1 FL=1